MRIQGWKHAAERRAGCTGKLSGGVGIQTEGIGKWMEKNGESIYGCGMSDMPRPDFGRITQKGNKLYYHIFDNTIGPVPLIGIEKKDVKKIRLISAGAEVPIADNWVSKNYPEITFADLGKNPILPDPVDTVLEVELVR